MPKPKAWSFPRAFAQNQDQRNPSDASARDQNPAGHRSTPSLAEGMPCCALILKKILSGQFPAAKRMRNNFGS
jgi:hypothetical protein